MFRRLTDFRYTRTAVEAIGFYLAYGIGGILAIAAVAGFAGTIDPSFGFNEGLILGAILATVVSAVLSFFILRAKSLLGNPLYVTIAALSVVGSIVAGLILGLIFVAFLTTRRPANVPQTITI